MSYIAIESFKYGLDTRRNELTSLPGTLVTLSDAHINQGGEAEKRFAFVRTSLVGLGIFDAVPTDSGILAIGSNADPGGWPRGPVTGYQRVQHPAVGIYGITYDAGKHAMTGVVWSTVQEGKSLLCATFADGFSFLYSNGSPVMQSYTGLYLSGFETASPQPDSFQIIRDVENGFLSINGWGAIDGANLSSPLASPGGAASDLVSAQILAPPGVTFSITATVPTACAFGMTNQGAQAAVAGTAATASFTIAGGAGKSYQVDLPLDTTSTYTGNKGVFYRLTVNWAVSNANTAGLIVAAINAITASTGFSAANGGTATVTVTAPLPASIIPTLPDPAYTVNPLIVSSADATANGSHSFSGGVTPMLASGQVSYVGLHGSGWALGSAWSMNVVPTTGDFTLGRGNLGNGWWSGGTVVSPRFGYIFNTRLYIANGNQFNFSALSDVTGYEQQNIGAGFIAYISQYGGVDTVQSFAAYQGRLAVLGRRSIQIWLTDADPNNFVLQQTLSNTGTAWPESVQSLGELDVIYLSDTGFRSLRVRDSSLNAFITDIGSPIDGLLAANLDPGFSACSVVDPKSGRYWCYNQAAGKIYVLSYYPLNKITAWSTYDPNYEVDPTPSATTYPNPATITFTLTVGQTYYWTPGANETKLVCGITTLTSAATFVALNATATVTGTAAGASYTGLLYGMVAFTPKRMFVYNGQVYIFSLFSGTDTAAIFQYGGTDGRTYDRATATIQTPWLAGKKPGTWKKSKGVDVTWSGDWTLAVGVDYTNEAFVTAYTPSPSVPSFDNGGVPFSARGTHFAFQAATTGNTAATLSQFVYHFTEEQETV